MMHNSNVQITIFLANFWHIIEGFDNNEPKVIMENDKYL